MVCILAIRLPRCNETHPNSWCYSEWRARFYHDPPSSATPDCGMDASGAQLDHVLVVEDVVAADRLAIVDRAPPDARGLHRVLEIAVNSPGQLRNRAADSRRKRICHVRRLAGLWCKSA